MRRHWTKVWKRWQLHQPKILLYISKMLEWKTDIETSSIKRHQRNVCSIQQPSPDIIWFVWNGIFLFLILFNKDLYVQNSSKACKVLFWSPLHASKLLWDNVVGGRPPGEQLIGFWQGGPNICFKQKTSAYFTFIFHNLQKQPAKIQQGRICERVISLKFACFRSVSMKAELTWEDIKEWRTAVWFLEIQFRLCMPGHKSQRH